MNGVDLTISESPLGVILVASVLCARGNSQNICPSGYGEKTCSEGLFYLGDTRYQGNGIIYDSSAIFPTTQCILMVGESLVKVYREKREGVRVMRKSLYKTCGNSFIPLIEEVLSRLPEEEVTWIEKNVRFTQRSQAQEFIDYAIRIMDSEPKDSDFYNMVKTQYQQIWEAFNKPRASTWKHGRYYYIRLNAVILDDEDKEDALATIAHELGHCFSWKPARQRRAETELVREKLADEWALSRGFNLERG